MAEATSEVDFMLRTATYQMRITVKAADGTTPTVLVESVKDGHVMDSGAPSSTHVDLKMREESGALRDELLRIVSRGDDSTKGFGRARTYVYSRLARDSDPVDEWADTRSAVYRSMKELTKYFSEVSGQTTTYRLEPSWIKFDVERVGRWQHYDEEHKLYRSSKAEDLLDHVGAEAVVDNPHPGQFSINIREISAGQAERET